MPIREVGSLWAAAAAMVLLVTALGHLTLRIVGVETRSTWIGLFARMLVGAILTGVLHAAWVTTGRTILALIPLVVALHWRDITRQGPGDEGMQPFRLPVSDALKLALGLVLVLALLTMRHYVRDDGLIFVGNYDYAVYSIIVDFISLSGHENTNAGAVSLSPSYWGVGPYHYFDLHFAKSVATLFGIRTIEAYAIAGAAVFALIVHVGWLAIAEHFAVGKRVGWMTHITSFAFLLSTALVLPFYYSGGGLRRLLTGSFDTPFLSSLNLLRSSAPQAVLIGSALWTLKGRWGLGCATLLLLAPMSAVDAPAVLGGAALFLLGMRTVPEHRSAVKAVFVSLATVGVGMALFYWILGAPRSVQPDLIVDYSSAQPVLWAIAYAGRHAFRTLWFYWPFALLLGGLLWGRQRKLWRWWRRGPRLHLLAQASLVLAIGLAAGSLLWQNFDGIQAYTNLARGYGLVLLVVGFHSILWPSLERRWMRATYLVGYGLLLGFAVVFTVQYNVLHNHPEGRRNTFPYSQHFYSAVKTELPPGRGPLHVAGFGTGLPLYPTDAGGPLFSQVRDGVATHFLDVVEARQRAGDTRRIDYATWRVNSAFAEFLERQGPFESLEEAQASFVRVHRIHHLLIAGGAPIPAELESRVEWQAIDPITDTRFARLRP